MLTAQSYVTAMLIYWVAAVVSLIVLRRLWFSQPLSRLSGALLGALAGLLLTPAFPGPEISTMAPALVIVIFNTMFGAGMEAAMTPGMVLLAGTSMGALIGRWWLGTRAVTRDE